MAESVGETVAAESQRSPAGLMFFERDFPKFVTATITIEDIRKFVMFVTATTTIEDIRKFVYDNFSICPHKQDLTFFRKDSGLAEENMTPLRPASGALEWQDNDLVRHLVSWKLKDSFSFRCSVASKMAVKKRRLN